MNALIDWISINDEKSPCGKIVLVADGKIVGDAYRTSADTYYRMTGFPWRAYGGAITHWMPLPELPQVSTSL